MACKDLNAHPRTTKLFRALRDHNKMDGFSPLDLTIHVTLFS